MKGLGIFRTLADHTAQLAAHERRLKTVERDIADLADSVPSFLQSHSALPFAKR